MLKLKVPKVAVTGGIATGKSTVCRLLEELGAYVISADSIVHELLTPETPIGKNVIALLGDSIVKEGALDREAIAQEVFRKPDLLEQLEKWLHPEVQKVINTKYQQISQQKTPLFVAEMPLLFEGGLENEYDYIIVVEADEARSQKRFHEKTRYDASEFSRRQKRLFPMEEKRKRADFVIENNGSFQELELSVKTIFNSLIGKIP